MDTLESSFFMISGFVIHNSLEKHKTLMAFYVARFRRIFPSLWIAIPFVFIFSNVLNQSFIAPIPISSLLPSLTLIGPDLLNEFLPTHFICTSSVLWSLFIEIQFYLVAGLIFFLVKKFNFNINLIIFGFFTLVLKIYFSALSQHSIEHFDNILPLNNHIRWFIAGSLIYSLRKNAKNLFLKSSFISTILINETLLNFNNSKFQLELLPTFITLVFYLAFYFVIAAKRKSRILTLPALVWLGGISYEFYLIHQAIGISILSKSREFDSQFTNNFLSFPLLLVVTFLVILLSAFLKQISNKIQEFFLKNSIPFLRII